MFKQNTSKKQNVNGQLLDKSKNVTNFSLLTVNLGNDKSATGKKIYRVIKYGIFLVLVLHWKSPELLDFFVRVFQK